MKQFFRHNGGILLVIAVLLSILITVLSAMGGGTANPLSAVVSTVMTPIQTGISSLIHTGNRISDYVFRYGELQEELHTQALKIAELEGQIRAAEDANRENEQLRELLGLSEKRQDFVLESARVSARKNSNWADTLTISKGSGDGIEVGDCVIDEMGNLLGIVDVVAPTSASVYTIVDSKLSMGGMVSRTYSTGILEGEFSMMNDGVLKLGYLADDAQLMAGDMILTSGLGDVYPSGLVVGTVEALHNDPSGMSRYATIIPSGSLDNLIEVFVIKDFDVQE